LATHYIYESRKPRLCARWIEMGLILVSGHALGPYMHFYYKKIPMLLGRYPFDTHWVSLEKNPREAL